MKLSEVKSKLEVLETLTFKLPNGTIVPAHFHVTEIGLISKKFIDCGGIVRNESKINFQLWEANDFDHRLLPQKLIHIIQLSENELSIEDFEVEVEYQQDTIGKFGLDFNDGIFFLTNTNTDCLAKDNCGIPIEKLKTKIGEWKEKTSCCTPNSSCC